MDGRWRVHGTDSQGTRGTSQGGHCNCYGKGKKGNRGGIDDLVSATRLPVVQDGGGISSGTTRVVITDLSMKIPGIDGCAARVMKKSVHLSQAQGRTWTGGRVSRMGPYQHSWSHAYYVDRGETMCVRRCG